MRAECLPFRDAPDYGELLLSAPQAMMTHCPQWLEMLEEVTGGQALVLAVRREDQLLGALPCVLSPDLGQGRVLNSLPFFGSHGGPVRLAGADEPQVIAALAEGFADLAQDSGCRAATMILSPFETHSKLIRASVRPDLEDARTGQIAPLPEDPEQILDGLIHAKRRNNIRNALRKGVAVRQRHDVEALDWLRQRHEEGIRAKGGLPKPPLFFAWAARSVREGNLCSLLCAEQDGRIVAGALLARFNHVSEYLVPASDESALDANGLALVVYEGMRAAARRGDRFWNFGGTWATQHGVYGFKEQFGAQDFPYDYLIRVYDQTLASMTPAQLGAAFPHFYSIPYGACRT